MSNNDINNSTKEELKNWFMIDNKSGFKTREINFKKKFPDDYELIIKIDFVDDWYEKLYWYINNITEKPTCKNENCKNHVKFKGYSKGYGEYCSIQCRNTDSNLINKTKNTLLGKYNVDNPMKLRLFKEKSKSTKNKKYGDENFVNIEKAKKTKKEKYGDENYSNRKKAVETTIKRYGLDNYGNRIKAKKTTIDRYGVEYYSQTEEHRKSVKNTYKAKTNDDLNKINTKRKNTTEAKYGVSFFSQSKEYKNSKIKQQIIKKALNLNINVGDIDYDILNKKFKINNYCELHNEFEINYDVLKNRLLYGIENICTICNPVSKNTSIKEIELREFINSLNIPFTENDRKMLNGKEIDIYIPSHNLAVEFNGLYWHSSLKIPKDTHQNKTENCELQRIQLLHVFENEWINKKEIVKSIIKSKLKIFDTKLFARKTEIREIKDNNLIKEFLNKNHIQGFVGSSIKLGLYYNNELVSLMTFGKKRISMGNKQRIDGEYELLRFCSKLNTQIIGGASKLLKYFIKNFNPKSILTFANRRYSNGNLYKKLGFEHIGNTKPNYWYFKQHEYILHYRFNFRKDVLIKEGFDPNKTEFEIMSEKGYSRIYDSGNMKFIINF